MSILQGCLLEWFCELCLCKYLYFSNILLLMLCRNGVNIAILLCMLNLFILLLCRFNITVWDSCYQEGDLSRKFYNIPPHYTENDFCTYFFTENCLFLSVSIYIFICHKSSEILCRDYINILFTYIIKQCLLLLCGDI